MCIRDSITNLVCGEPSRLDTGWRSAIAGDSIRSLLAGDVAAAFRPDGTLVLEPRQAPPAAEHANGGIPPGPGAS